MIAWHALFSSRFCMSACVDVVHTGAVYSAIEYHRANATVFVPH